MSPGEMNAQQSQRAPQGNNKAQGSDLNPVVEAFQTLMQFIAAKAEQGDPKADEMRALLAQFITLIKSDVGQAMPTQGQPQMPPSQQGQPQMPMGKPMANGGQGGVNPMLGKSQMGKSQMGRQVPVI